MNLYQVSFQLYMLLQNVIISIRKIEYFTYHAKRCKRLEDKIRVLLLYINELEKITSTFISIKELYDSFKESVLPKVKSKTINYINCVGLIETKEFKYIAK